MRGNYESMKIGRRTFLRSTGVLLGSGALTLETVNATGSDEITILTDEHSVSHVYADDLYGMAFANGYVQARDRLFEMDVLRHIGYGNSAEVLGPSQLQSDIEVRRDLYSKREIKRQYETASDRTQRVLEAFADGVNRKMVELAASGQLPGTFTALAHAPAPWTPADSIAVLSYLIGYFGVSGGNELANAQELAQLTQSLDDERSAYEAFGDRNWLRIREDHSTSISAEDLTVDGGEEVLPYEDVPDEQLRFVDAALDAEPWGIENDFSLSDFLSGLRRGEEAGSGVMEGFKWGSNALIVSGEHTETGSPMLGGGPQMGYFKPPVIHQVGLHGAGYDVTGIGVVGTPGIVIGRTPEFAWTVTSGRDDQVDTIAVELHPEDKHRYKWDGEWHSMQTETVVHNASVVGSIVSGDPDVRVVKQEIARIEENGDVMPVIAWNSDERVAWCQRTTTRYQELEGAFMWADLGTRDDLDGFKDQISEFPFTFNFHYIDSEDIAYIHTGSVPDRNPSLDHRLPAPGSDHQWRGKRVGLGLQTSYTNPSSGYVVNWNNGPCAGWRAGDAPQQWGSTHRVELLDRFTRSALADGPLSLQDVKQIIERAATHDASAPYTVPALIDAVHTSSDAQLRAMADELQTWKQRGYAWRDANEDGRYDSGGMAIWEETRRELQRLVFEDELDEQTPDLAFDPPETRHAADHGRAHQETTLVDAIAGRTTHDWFGGVTDRSERTQNHNESVRTVLRQALEQAAQTLEKRYESANPEDWLLSVRESTFRSLGASKQTSIKMVNRATYNQAVAVGEGLEGSQHILAPSNDGNMTLPEVLATQLGGDEPDRLTDQLDEYAAFEYAPNPYTREQVETIATDHQTLRAYHTSIDGPIEPTGQISERTRTQIATQIKTNEDNN